MADVYISQNQNVTPLMIDIVYTVSLEISIKMNEDMLLAFSDLCTLFNNMFELPLFLQLEKHIMTLNKLKLDPPTPLDFVL